MATLFLISFISCRSTKEVKDLPKLDIEIIELYHLLNLPIYLGSNDVKIHIKSQSPFKQECRLNIFLKDGYTFNNNVNIPILIAEGDILDTLIIYKIKEVVRLPNSCDFGLISINIISGKYQSKITEVRPYFEELKNTVIGQSRYFKSHCIYYDGGIYNYTIKAGYFSLASVKSESIKDEFGFLPNSVLKVTDTLTSKTMSNDEFLSLLNISREIQKIKK